MDRELADFLRRMRLVGLAVLVLMTFGTVGFHFTEHQDLWDAFQLTVDIVATTGSLPSPTDTAGEIVKVLLTFVGVGTLFYGLVTLAEFFVSGNLGEILEQRRRERMSQGLSDHYIICGYGRVGRQVARDLRAAGVRYVVVDPNPDNVRDAQDAVGVRAIHAPPSDDDALRDAGVTRARAVVACNDSDAENIFITLTARELNPQVAIVARASREESESKLIRAGADRVISPYKSSGAEMARLALHPQVTGLVDVDGDFRLEEIEVGAGSEGVGRALADVLGGTQVVGLKRADGFSPQPPTSTVLAAGDIIIVMGTPRAMDRMERLFSPEQANA